MADELILKGNEISIDMRRHLSNIENMLDKSEYETRLYRDQSTVQFETQEQFFEYIKSDFSVAIIESIEKLNSKSDVNITVDSIQGITDLSSMVLFLSDESLKVDSFIESIDDQFDYFTNEFIPTTLETLDEFNSDIKENLNSFNELFQESSDVLKANLMSMNETIDEYTNSVNQNMTDNVNMIDNSLSNTLGGVGKGLGSFISQFAIQTSTALPILGTNIALFFGALANPATLVGMGAFTLSVMGVGKGFEYLSNGISNIVESFDEFITKASELSGETDLGEIAEDMIKLSGGIISLNTALSMMLVSSPSSFLGLKLLSSYIDDIGESYTDNKEAITEIVDLFQAMNTDVNLEPISESINGLVSNIPTIDLKATIDVINLEEIQNIAVSLNINRDELDGVLEQVKEVRVSRVPQIIETPNDILNPTNNETQAQVINNADGGRIISELQTMNSNLMAIIERDEIKTKETKQEIEKASFFGSLNGDKDDVGFLDKISGIFGKDSTI